MPSPTAVPAFDRFRREGILTRAGLMRGIMRAAAYPGRARPEIEAGHLRWLGRASTSVTRVVAETEGDLLRLCRDLVAAADPGDIPLWRHALAHGALRRFGPVVEVDRIIAAVEGKGEKPCEFSAADLAAIERATNQKPAALVETFLGRWPIALALIEEMPPPGARTALVRVLTAYESAWGGKLAVLPKDACRLAVAVGAMAKRRPALRLSLGQFRRLPKAFADHSGLYRQLLSDAGRAQVKAADDRALARQRAARSRADQREAERKRRLHASLHNAVAAVAAAVNRGAPLRAARVRPVERAAAAIVRSSGPALFLNMMAREMQRLADPNPAGAQALEAAVWDAAFKAITRVGRIGWDEVDQVTNWLIRAPIGAIESYHRIQPAPCEGIPRSVTAIERVLLHTSGRRRATLLGLGDSKLVDRMCRELAPRRWRSQQRLLRHAIGEEVGKPGRPQSIADTLVANGPAALGLERTLALIGEHLDGRRLAAMFVGQARSSGADARELVAHCLQSRQRPIRRAWRELLEGLSASQSEAAPLVWGAVLARGPEEALSLFVKHPEAFARAAAKALPIAWLLVEAARRPRLGAVLDPLLDPAACRKALLDARLRLNRGGLLFAVLELAVLVGLREMPHLREIARTLLRRKDAPLGTQLDDRYRTYSLPKRSGGKRTISVPDESLMRLQRLLLAKAFEEVPIHDAAHGFRKGRSILTNARAHVGKRLVVNVDISGFFPGTAYASVLEACRKVQGGGVSAVGARLLAAICCSRGALPTGAPTSPVLGNIVLRRADAAVAKAAAAHGITYTRYADDLTFSGSGDTKRILPFVRKVLLESGYGLDSRKTQFYRKGRQQLVTSLVVNDRANLRRSDRRRLRAAVDRRCKGGEVIWHSRPISDAALSGWVALLGMIEPERAAEYRRRLRADAPDWGSRRA